MSSVREEDTATPSNTLTPTPTCTSSTTNYIYYENDSLKEMCIANRAEIASGGCYEVLQRLLAQSRSFLNTTTTTDDTTTSGGAAARRNKKKKNPSSKSSPNDKDIIR